MVCGRVGLVERPPPRVLKKNSTSRARARGGRQFLRSRPSFPGPRAPRQRRAAFGSARAGCGGRRGGARRRGREAEAARFARAKRKTKRSLSAALTWAPATRAAMATTNTVLIIAMAGCGCGAGGKGGEAWEVLEEGRRSQNRNREIFGARRMRRGPAPPVATPASLGKGSACGRAGGADSGENSPGGGRKTKTRVAVLRFSSVTLFFCSQSRHRDTHSKPARPPPFFFMQEEDSPLPFFLSEIVFLLYFFALATRGGKKRRRPTPGSSLKQTRPHGVFQA